MDTPECDISAIESGTMEPLPTYTVHDDGQDSFQALLATLCSPIEGDHPDPTILDEITESQNSKPLLSYPEPPFGHQPSAVMLARQTIINGFFSTISQSQEEGISLFLSKNLVTANTTNEIGKTPLLTAIETRSVRIVKQLLDAGGDPNAFGVMSKTWDWSANDSVTIKRTPLMLAASLGHLALVKLLMEVYHADDSLVAPDGQIALRLASSGGHREIVDYLPSRRSGGFLRWQTEHQKAIRRAKKALMKAYHFCKFFVWDIEKFFLWTVPKECIVKPLSRGCKWCWNHRKGFGPWCAEQARQMPARVKRFGSWLWRGMKKVPKAIGEVCKATWDFGTKTLPKVLKSLVVWCWSLLTRRIPHAIAIIAKWIWGGISSAAKSIWNIFMMAVSLLHTVFTAVLTFFRNLTLRDIWDGFCSLLRSIFITFPQTLGLWIVAFGETSYKVMKTIFGLFGSCLWWIMVGLGWLVIYVPGKLWIVLCSLGSSFANGMHEVWVWFSPKA